MFDPKRVLVVIDPYTHTQLALEKTLELEKICEFEIRLIACDYSQHLVEGYYFDAVQITDLRSDYLTEKREALGTLAAPLIGQGLSVTVDALWGHPPFESIVLEALGYQPDLVVHSTRRHSRLSRMFLSNEDWQLVRTCPFPLWLVKEKPWKRNPVVLAAVDPKHTRGKPAGLDHKIISHAKELAERVSGELHVMHSYSQIPLSGTYPEDARREHEEAFETLMDEFAITDEHRHLEEESADLALQRLEQNLGVDLIVMGAVSRSRLSEVFIGNTAERVLDYLESDVLIIKADEFESPIVAD